MKKLLIILRIISVTLMFGCSKGLTISSEEALLLITKSEVAKEKVGLPDDSNSLRLCVLVEPSPFTYVSGYSNRYQELFRSLQRSELQQVEVITVEVVAKDLPHKAFGFPIHYTRGMRLPFYKRMSISIDWTLQSLRKVRRFRPNLIHCSSP